MIAFVHGILWWLGQMWRELCCWNHKYEFMRNIYGDEILAVDGRSWWRCEHCHKPIVRQELHKGD
jgi:hypothetical protein